MNPHAPPPLDGTRWEGACLLGKATTRFCSSIGLVVALSVRSSR